MPAAASHLELGATYRITSGINYDQSGKLLGVESSAFDRLYAVLDCGHRALVGDIVKVAAP